MLYTFFFFLKSVRQYTYCINKLYYSAFQFDFFSNYGWKAKKDTELFYSATPPVELNTDMFSSTQFAPFQELKKYKNV